jgi:hypothetical protein
LLNKFGSPEKITKVTGSFTFDPNLIVFMLKEKVIDKKITLDQLHEAVKSVGVIDYSSEDMGNLIRLLQSSGISVI